MLSYTTVPTITVVGPGEPVKWPKADEKNRKSSFPQRGPQYRQTPGMGSGPNSKTKAKKNK